MNNTKLVISNPWLLLLLIPTIVLALYPYFRIKKDRRRTRNRIVSMVLHLITMLLVILVLAGFSIDKTEYIRNETIFVVDLSKSTENQRDKMEEYINAFLAKTDKDSKVGIVTFGNEYRKSVELKTGLANINMSDLNKDVSPNGSQLAKAMEYAISLLEENETSVSKRLVLFTDGLETDGKAIQVAQLAGSKDIRVDGIFFPPIDYSDTFEAQILDVNVTLAGEETTKYAINIYVSSHKPSPGRIRIFNNGTNILGGNEYNPVTLDGSGKKQNENGTFGQLFTFEYNMFQDGLNVVRVELETNEDVLSENNVYYTTVEVSNKKSYLIVTNDDATGVENLIDSMAAEEVNFEYEKMVIDPSDFPDSAEELTKYGQVILMNVNADHFSENQLTALDDYVRRYGGGLLVTGGDDIRTQDHLNGNFVGNKIEELLPVDIKPDPDKTRALTIVLDISNSMFMYDSAGNTLCKAPSDSSSDYARCGAGIPNTRIDVARKGIIQSLESDKFNKYDYISVIVYGRTRNTEDATKVVLPLTSIGDIKGNWDEVKSTIQGISAYKEASGGGTNYDNALLRARQILTPNRIPGTVHDIDKKSVLFITDLNDDSATDQSTTFFRHIEKIVADKEDGGAGATFNIISITRAGLPNKPNMQKMIDIIRPNDPINKKGEYVATTNEAQFSSAIEKFSTFEPTPEINEEGPYAIKSADKNSTIFANLPNINGYNGVTVKKSESSFNAVSKVLEHVNNKLDNLDPIYARWAVGSRPGEESTGVNGKVGFLATDINGSWGSSLLTDPNGVKALKYIFNNDLYSLSTGKSVNNATVYLEEDGNFVRKLTNVTTTNQGKYKMETVVRKIDEKTHQVDNSFEEFETNLGVTAGANGFYGNIEIDQPGVYEVEFKKYDGSTLLSTTKSYITFAYSKEYDTNYNYEELFTNNAEICDTAARSASAENSPAKSSLALSVEDNEELNIEETLDELNKVTTNHNFQVPFILIAMILLLLDIACRKFNWKWPHEWFKKKES